MQARPIREPAQEEELAAVELRQRHDRRRAVRELSRQRAIVERNGVRAEPPFDQDRPFVG
jgi:hypothetical protein